MSDFDYNTIAIRISYKYRGSERQSQVFFPNPTLEEALDEAKKVLNRHLLLGATGNLTEAKRVFV